MEIALIAPPSLLDYVKNREYHMVLPVYLKDSNYYRYYYERTSILAPVVHTMLDCGAYEGEALGGSELLNLAHDLRADEVISPDTMGDAVASYKKLTKLLSYRKHPSRAHKRNFHIMVPVQGRSVEECYAFVDRVAAIAAGNAIKTFGLPKCLVETTSWAEIRITLLRYIQERYEGAFDVHFLGYNSHGETLQAALRGARSMDTSMPFVVAAAGWSLGEHKQIPRDRELDLREAMTSTPPDPELVKGNIDLLDAWAHISSSDQPYLLTSSPVDGETITRALYVGEQGPESRMFHDGEKI